MGSKDVPLAFSFTLLLILVGFASSSLDQDRAECADQLVGLATCLPYVGGDAKAPTLDCCTGLKQVLQKSRKCLCILIKDRDDPNLGIKINATLALGLPSACHAPLNNTECVSLLHLAPNSTDAKIFAHTKHAFFFFFPFLLSFFSSSDLQLHRSCFNFLLSLKSSLLLFTKTVAWFLIQERERAGRYSQQASLEKLLEIVKWKLMGETAQLLIEKQKAENHGTETYHLLKDSSRDLVSPKRAQAFMLLHGST